MIHRKVKGSLIYEILIVILLSLLVGTILYPKSVWEVIEQDTDLCRENMKKVQNAEILFLQLHISQKFDSSIVNVIEFLKNDSAWVADTVMNALRDSFFVSTIKDYLTTYEEVTDTTAADSALKLVLARSDTLSNRETVDALIEKSLDLLHLCPSIGKPYHIGSVDTSIIKVLKVYCPLDSTNMDSLNDRFTFSFLGGGKIGNHGNIDNGETSWKEKKK